MNKNNLNSGSEPNDKLKLSDKGNSYQFILAIPELKKEDLNLSIKGNEIVLETKKQSGNSSCNHVYKTVELPKNADVSKIKAQMGNGILAVCIAKTNENNGANQ